MSIQDSNQGQSLYAARIPIFPRRVKGTFRTLKWWIMGVTLAIYYLTPWIRWDRGPAMPDQAVLVDLANRRFFFFWIEIWPQQFIYVAGLLIMAGLGLFLFTSALGRVWCGYTCPQTVWTDLFITVERWIEGDRNARVRLHQQKWDARKARLRATKWLVWLLIAVATGGAWVFYFADAPSLLVDLFTGQAPFVAYASVGVLTATTFVFGGFMREQVCIYMCPWPRIQAAMMDDKTITVGYRHWRGEPRGKHRKKNADAGLGDCIDCNACVAVCPMGIDIRDGQQLACITCALCIDACDDVMEKVGKPRGLIDYVTLQDEAIETQGAQPIPLIKRILRPRTILYFVMWAGIGLGIVVSLFMRDSIDLTVARDRNPTFVVLSDGSIRNGYTIKVANQNQEPHDFVLSFRSDLPLTAEIQGLEWLEFEVEADKLRQMRLFLTTLPFARPTERAEVEIWIEDLETRERVAVDTFFLAPEPGDWGP
ncbi:MAG: cytochrome c oxidase accessory protein CcoG [Albimonas sp.]|uniref:cytochrome c oxidase accessory protein CcoG n=1 Tax=Albimonas sp. TaxID=1872425 RepID=UPI00405750B2